MTLRALSAAFCIAASQAAAFEVASPQECNDIWRTFVDLMPVELDEDNNPNNIVLVATDDGWCRMQKPGPGLDDAQFETFDFRIDGINRFLVDRMPPPALDLRFFGLVTEGDNPRRLSQVLVSLSHDQASRSLLVQNFELTEDTGGRFQMTAVFSNLDLTSTGTMMMSLGGIALSQMAGVVTVVSSDDLVGARDTPEQDREMFLTALATLPDGTLSDNSLQSLRSFLTDDQETGRLSFTLSSARGIGLLQTVVGRWIEETVTQEDYNQALEIMLDGVTLSFDWDPTAPIDQ